MKEKRIFARRENSAVLSPTKRRVQGGEYDIKDHHIAVQSGHSPNVIFTDAKYSCCL